MIWCRVRIKSFAITLTAPYTLPKTHSSKPGHPRNRRLCTRKKIFQPSMMLYSYGLEWLIWGRTPNYLWSLIAWEKLTICPCFAVFLISAISFFSWVWRLCLSRSISLMDLSSIRLFSRRSSARQTHNQQRILYNKQRSTQANPTWGGSPRVQHNRFSRNRSWRCS